MSATWYGDPPPPPVSFGILEWIRIITRGIPLALVVFGGLVVLLALRLVERPVFGASRPVSPYITVFVCRAALRIMGIRLEVQGAPIQGQGAIVANHSSWLDIFVLNATERVYFVSKAEVARWPGIGWLARATGTVFVERTRTKAAEQAETFQQRLKAGHKLLFFPEGTSSDGTLVLPFKTTLFSAFMTPDIRDKMQVQPATVTYRAAPQEDVRFYGWWGDMDFGSHFLAVLSVRRQGTVRVVYHDALAVRDFDDRKALAKTCEEVIRHAHSA